MKTPGIVVSATILLATVAYFTYPLLASEDTRIRWMLEDSTSSFNTTYLAGCLEGFAEDYRDESFPELDRDLLRRALQVVFLREVNGQTKEFQTRVLLPEENLQILVGDTEDQATAEFRLYLEQRTGEEWKPKWELQVTAKLGVVDGNWRIRSSSHQTLNGARPW